MSRKIFVGSLPLYIDNKSLTDYFREFGDITESFVVLDKDGKSKRYGFVTFSDVSSLENCLQSRPHNIDNVEVDVKEASMAVPVENFDVHVLFPDKFKIDRDATLKHFSEFGEVCDCIIPFDGNGEPKRYCVIKFHKGESALEATEDKKQKFGETTIIVSKLLSDEELASDSFNRYASCVKRRRVFRNTPVNYGDVPKSSRVLQIPARNNYAYMAVMNQSYSQTLRNSSAPYRKSRYFRKEVPLRRHRKFLKNCFDRRGNGMPPFPSALTDQTIHKGAKTNNGFFKHGHINSNILTAMPQKFEKDVVKMEPADKCFDIGSKFIVQRSL